MKRLFAGLFSATLITYASMVLAVPAHASEASQATIISRSGQRLLSIFEGLKPSAVLQFRALANSWLRNSRRALGTRRLPGVQCIQFTEGDCPTSACSGNYNSTRITPGGCAVEACDPVEDAYTDLNAPCENGVQDVECGDGTICCANAEICFNARGCI